MSTRSLIFAVRAAKFRFEEGLSVLLKQKEPLLNHRNAFFLSAGVFFKERMNARGR
jgi:hypothetical protein